MAIPCSAPPGLSTSDPETATHSRERRRMAAAERKVGQSIEGSIKRHVEDMTSKISSELHSLQAQMDAVRDSVSLIYSCLVASQNACALQAKSMHSQQRFDGPSPDNPCLMWCALAAIKTNGPNILDETAELSGNVSPLHSGSDQDVYNVSDGEDCELPSVVSSHSSYSKDSGDAEHVDQIARSCEFFDMSERTDMETQTEDLRNFTKLSDQCHQNDDEFSHELVLQEFQDKAALLLSRLRTTAGMSEQRFDILDADVPLPRKFDTIDFESHLALAQRRMEILLVLLEDVAEMTTQKFDEWYYWRYEHDPECDSGSDHEDTMQTQDKKTTPVTAPLTNVGKPQKKQSKKQRQKLRRSSTVTT
eukprot:TRINITY_DN4147_c0_g2_i2.p1 TRINITY_DN4147_c0_g2~~TRINITY_DN4147_c0_g2_i2.p1  ORF type:complete len:362 (+),score=57.67 TRINITY_DN4147_c0_g2_i2:237-1322(+)